MDNEITIWEKIARTRWGSYQTKIEKRVITKASCLAGNPTTALEIGCEGGRWTRLLIELGWNMAATEVDPDMIEVCQRRVPSAKYILVDANDRRIPCETGSKKLLLCIEVHPVSNSDWFLYEASRTLEHKGLLVCTVTNPLSFRGVLYRIACKILRNKIDYGYYTNTQPYHKFKKEIIQNGFRLIYEEGYCWMPFNRKSNSRFISILTEFERFLGLRRITSLSPSIIFIAQKI